MTFYVLTCSCMYRSCLVVCEPLFIKALRFEKSSALNRSCVGAHSTVVLHGGGAVSQTHWPAVQRARGSWLRDQLQGSGGEPSYTCCDLPDRSDTGTPEA